jgi:hypothetical protein
MLTQYHSSRARSKASWNIHADSFVYAFEYSSVCSQSAFRSSHQSLNYVVNRSQFAYRSSSTFVQFVFISERSSLTSINRENEIKLIISSLESSFFVFASASSKSRLYQSISRNLSDRSKSRNSWINNIKKLFFAHDRFCVRCDYIKHTSRECTNDSLSSWKQSYLKKIVFDQSTQINHLSIYDFAQKSSLYENFITINFECENVWDDLDLE